MNNELKQFLEGENERFYKEPVRELRLKEENADGGFSEQAIMHNWLKDHDTRLINFVLDLVKKEVEKNVRELKRCVRDSDYCCISCESGLTSCEYVEENRNYNQALIDTSTTIDNLKVK